LSKSEKTTRLKAKVDQGPVKEKVVTQAMRQAAFDSQELPTIMVCKYSGL
jgi:hypothetical protein